LGATFLATFATVNGLNAEFCDPFFRVIDDVQGARVEQIAEQQQQRQLQQGQIFPSSEPSSAPSSAPTLQQGQIFPSSEPSSAPSSSPTMSPAKPFVDIFSFLIIQVSGSSRGSGNDDLNGFLLDPFRANQVSNRRLGQGQDAYEIDPSRGMVTDRRLQEDEVFDCVCVADAERRGVSVSWHCILLLDCIATKDSWADLIVMHFLCSYYPLL
jgi:hypothetical protein